ncbi:MAG: hypothetical protein FD161_1221 [Limisphaerales bacterium]|nr:MAG: hypothetical protein FD161_1221 [Limisphaerales bacterium]TXT49491.1 MAG: hypothetical protein FD140_3023 [Limisphaerales bacterium]
MICDDADLLRAYRKAKVDVYYERDQDLAHEFCKFEEDLPAKLRALRRRIQLRDWTRDRKVVGTVRYAPKSIRADSSQSETSSAIHTASAGRWRLLEKTPEVEFRPHCHSSVEWHILSALWVAKVGHRFDALLDRACHGNRVRRVIPREPELERETEPLGPFHVFGLGSFESYLPAYRRWRDAGLAVMKKQLEAKVPVIGVTADVKRFYHEVDASFMTSPQFLKLLAQDSLLPSEEGFHSDMIESIGFWATSNKVEGLPVGLGASRLIANAMLVEFDRAMLKRVNPLYYGRYVDDIFLVVRDVGIARELEEVWAELAAQLNREVAGMVSVTGSGKGFKVEVAPSFGGANQKPLVFEGKKQKAFFLDPVGGPTLMASIESHIRESSSAWNHLPELADAEELADLCFLSHSSSPAEMPDVLRKADRVSIRRSRFAMRLRDLEAVCEDLAPAQWAGIRRTFIGTVRREIAETPELFNFASYLPRVLSLAVASNDLESAAKLVSSIRQGFAAVSRILRPSASPKGQTTQAKWKEFKDARARFGEQLLTAVARAWPTATRPSKAEVAKWEAWADRVARDFGADRLTWSHKGRTSKRLAFAHEALFSRDLALRPFRAALFDGVGRDFLNDAPAFSIRSSAGWWGPKSTMVHKALFRFLREMWGYDGRRVPAPLLFPTRPFSFAELTLLSSSRGEGELVAAELGEWLQSLRGSFGGPEVGFGSCKAGSAGLGEVHFPVSPEEAPDRTQPRKVKLAITCFLTEDSSFRAGVHQVPEPTLDRYRRATSLINAVLHSGTRPDYVIFPELSLRSNWFNRFAVRLARSGISLIAGLDYQLAPGSNTGPAGSYRLVNQVRCSLVTTASGYRSPAFYVQNKQEPAPVERVELAQLNNSTLSNGGLVRRDIVVHGAWRFGLLICNELTDLEARTALRGNVDGLIVPEWNKDVNSFNALVEATALDLPAYVVQVNNRRYGDSRVRQPHQDAWLRDLTRVKGGELDYFTVVSLDISALRFFQTHAISPDQPFKPTPTGFKIHPSRRRTQP